MLFRYSPYFGITLGALLQAQQDVDAQDWGMCLVKSVLQQSAKNLASEDRLSSLKLQVFASRNYFSVCALKALFAVKLLVTKMSRCENGITPAGDLPGDFGQAQCATAARVAVEGRD